MLERLKIKQCSLTPLTYWETDKQTKIQTEKFHANKYREKKGQKELNAIMLVKLEM